MLKVTIEVNIPEVGNEEKDGSLQGDWQTEDHQDRSVFRWAHNRKHVLQEERIFFDEENN